MQNNINALKQEYEAFLKYIKSRVEADEISILYITRENDYIHYGKINHGVREDVGNIKMTDENSLKTLYELLKTEFSSLFSYGSKHTFGMGWSLYPTISDNILIEIESNSSADEIWFYEEVQKNREINAPKSK